ncbi:MAG: BolA family protein [Methylophaga sp.]|nr:BolA family protein [Methylophaga sp.]
MNTQDELSNRLQTLAPVTLEIIDESHLHAGHAGNTGGGHFNVLIVSEQFAGLLPLKRHRLVYDAVGDMMQSEIHALSIVAKTPAEFHG